MENNIIKENFIVFFIIIFSSLYNCFLSECFAVEIERIESESIVCTGINTVIEEIGRYKLNIIGADNISRGCIVYGGYSSSDQYYSLLSTKTGYDWVKDYEKDTSTLIKGNSTGATLIKSHENDKIKKAYLQISLADHEGTYKEVQTYPVTVIGPNKNAIEVDIEYVFTAGARTSGYVDITEFVSSQGYGEYIVCNIPYEYKSTDSDIFGAWRLLVLEENEILPIRYVQCQLGKEQAYGYPNPDYKTLSINFNNVTTKREGTVTGQLYYMVDGGDISNGSTLNAFNFSKNGTSFSNISYSSSSYRKPTFPVTWQQTRNGISIEPNTNYKKEYYVKNGYSNQSSGARAIGNVDTELLDIDGTTTYHSVTFPNNQSSFGIRFGSLGDCVMVVSGLGVAIDIESPEYETTIATNIDKTNVIIEGSVGNIYTLDGTGLYNTKTYITLDENFAINENMKIEALYNGTTIDDTNIEIDGNEIVINWGDLSNDNLTLKGDILTYTITGLATNPQVGEYTNTTYTNGNMYSNSVKTDYFISNIISATSVVNRSTGKIIVEYIDEISKEVLAKEELINYVGEVEEVSSKNFEGYSLITNPENNEIEYLEDDITITYGYRKISEGVEVKYINQETGEELLHSELIEGVEGTEYITSAKEIDGYTLVVTPENVNGSMTVKKIIVIYEYLSIDGKITITKLDRNDESKVLSGATFKIEKLDDDNNIDSSYTATELITDANGKVEFTDLVIGKYRITEIKAPEGYELSEDVIDVEITSENKEINIIATDRLKLELPKTGGRILAFYILGAILIIFSVILCIRLNKKEA